MKKAAIWMLALALVLALSAGALAERVDYVDRGEDFTFTYDTATFEITVEDYQDDDEDANLVLALKATNASWGEALIQFSKAGLESKGELEASLQGLRETGLEVNQGEWNGFDDVYSYISIGEEETESCFMLMIDDDELLNILIIVDNIEDETALMERDDAISEVLDTLVILDD